MRNFVKNFIFGVLFFTFIPSTIYGGSLSGYVYNDKDRNQQVDAGESGTGEKSIIKLCKHNILRQTFNITTSNATGYYEFNFPGFGPYTIIEDETNSSSCSVSSDPAGWSSSSSNYISVKLSGINPSENNLNFGNFKDDVNPLTVADREKAYLFQNKPSDVYSLDLVTGKLTKQQDNITPSAYHVNGLGYNVKDGYFWGSAPRRGEFSADGYIIRVGKDSSGNWVTTDYGPIPNLNIFSYAGDIDKDGKLYLNMHGQPFMSIIDLDPNSPTYLTADSLLLVKSTNILITKTVYSTDWAFNPKDDMLYTVINGKGTHSLLRINPKTGTVEDLGDTKISNSHSGGTMGSTGVLPPGHPALVGIELKQRVFGGSFFTKDGYYYLYANGVGRPNGEVYRIDVTNPSGIIDPTAVSFSKPRHTSLNDGVMFADNMILLDFGDAPDDGNKSIGDGTAMGNYRTLLSDDGPRHQLPSTGATIYLGVLPPDINNSEDDGQPTLTATGDGVEEDGVSMNSTSFQGATIKVGSKINLDIKTVGNGVLNAWIDFDRDGNFSNSEQISKNTNGSSGTVNLTNIIVPLGAKDGVTYARFRYSSDTDLNATGAASDGEIEDYMINIDADKNLFGAWDIDESISSPVIKTKIVNKDINLSIASIDANGTGYASSIYSIVEASIYSGSNQLTTWRDVNLTDKNITDIEFGKISTAHKVAYVAIQYFDANGTRYDTNLSEKFAIRPDRFVFDTPAIGKVGEPFAFAIKAVGVDDNNASDYNESYNVSFQIEHNETKSGCATGTIDLSSVFFSDGGLKSDINYSEVGEVDFDIFEIAGSEFAAIDSNDTLDLQRYIGEANTTIMFTASQFVFKQASLQDGAGIFTFYASDENTTQMGALLELSIVATDGGGSVTKNYSDTCYSKDVNISLDFNTTGNNLNKLVLADGSILNGVYNFIPSTPRQVTYVIKKDKFIDGEANVSMSINFDRNRTIAKNPMNFTISQINATNSEGVLGVQAVDESSDFYYGRVNIPNYTGTGSKHNISVYQEVYCKNCDRNVFELAKGRESENGIFWRIIPKGKYDTSRDVFRDTKPKNTKNFSRYDNYETMTATSFMIDEKGTDTMKMSIPKFPYVDRITFETDPWLIFNIFGTRSTRSFNVNITSGADSWAGKGEQGKAVDKDGASERSYQKMEW